MIDQKHKQWIRKKFPIFYTIQINFDENFTSIELDLLQSERFQQETSKQNKKILKKLRKLAFQAEKQFKSNKQLYNILASVKPQFIHQIILVNKAIQSLKPLEYKNLLKLSEIDFGFNKIKNLDPLLTSFFPSLAYANLTQNQIQSVSGLRQIALSRIKILNLSFNRINSIEPLSNFQFLSLQKLDLSQNLITRIQCLHKSSSWDLKFVDIKNNKFNSLKKIQRFRFNRILQFSLKGNPLIDTSNIEKLQETTIKNIKKTSQRKLTEPQKTEQFAKYQYKLFYSKMIHLTKKQDWLLEIFEGQKSIIKNPTFASKHWQFAVIDEYKSADKTNEAISTKKIYFY